MSRFNLVDETWIPVRFLDGVRAELGIQETLLQSAGIAAIEDPSPLVVGALHRFLLAVLHRTLEGPCDIDQAKDLFRDGLPADKIKAHLKKWRFRFWLFDEEYPFYQVPDYNPKIKNGQEQWRSWAALAAEHNADNAKVLFDHLDVSDPKSISASRATRWLIACQTFALGGGNSDFTYTKGGPSAGGMMAIPLGNNLQDTLVYSLVQQNRDIAANDLPAWERPPESAGCLQRGCDRNICGLSDLYTWQTRSIRLNPEEPGDCVSKLVFASGVVWSSKNFIDPMVPYRVDNERGMIPLQLTERGLWRSFDSLLPQKSNPPQGPVVMEHAISIGGKNRDRFPKSILVLGQANNKAKIEFWRMEIFSLPPALMNDGNIRSEIYRILLKAEEWGKSLSSVCSAFAVSILGHGDRKPDRNDVNDFVSQMPCMPLYWSALELEFHKTLQAYTIDANLNQIMLEWLKSVRRAFRDAWNQHESSVRLGDAWCIRALVQSEIKVRYELLKLDKQIAEFVES